MANIYVSTTGSDSSGDGSSSNPYRHIYYAIDQASDGDTIIIKSGTYHEDENRRINSKSLTIKSETEDFKDVEIIVDGVPNTYYSTAAYILLGTTSSYTLTLKGLTFKWGTATYSHCKAFIAGIDSAPNITISYCFFDGSNIPSGDHHVGVGTRRTYDVKIYKCTFRHLKSDSYSGGIVLWDNNNTLDVKDCIFEDCEYGINNHAGTLTEDHNDFYNNNNNLYSGSLDSSDITSDPKFNSSDSAEIESSSPCIDEGVTVTNYVETYEGSAPDIGADEVNTTTEVLSDISSDIRARKELLSDINQDIRFVLEGLEDINTNIRFKKNYVYVEWARPSGFDGLDFTYYYTTDGSEPDDSSDYTTDTHIYWTLTEGLNILKIKVKDSLGNWGMTSSFRLVYSDNDIEGGVAN